MPGLGGTVQPGPTRPWGALTVVALVLALGGCVLPGGQGDGSDDTPSIIGPEVETTTLPPAGEVAGTPPEVAAPSDPAGAGEQGTAAAEVSPEAAQPAQPAAEPAPPVVKSPAEIACEKLGGRLVRVGTGLATACQRVMRDAGKSCRRKSDCEGECLARSGTCAPLAPLFGCNDVLQDDGRQVSLCID
jgi:hypothetical protein